MTDEQIEKIIKRNMNLQMNLAGIRSDFQEALQRQWVGLTDEEVHECLNGLPTQTIDVYARRIEAKLKEKNT